MKPISGWVQMSSLSASSPSSMSAFARAATASRCRVGYGERFDERRRVDLLLERVHAVKDVAGGVTLGGCLLRQSGNSSEEKNGRGDDAAHNW